MEPFRVRLTGSGSGTLPAVIVQAELVDRAPPPDGVFALAISTVVAGSFDNGATWQVIDDNWSTTAVIWTGDRFIAAGIDVILTSPDGTTWTVVQEPDFNPWIDGIATDGDGTIVIIDTNDEVYTSTDGGDSFTSYTLPNGPTSLSGAAYGNNTFVVAGAASTPGRFWTSPDGTTWTERTTSLGQISGVEFGGGVFVAGGTGTDAYRSTDGITWTSHTAWGSNTTVQNVAYGNGRFLLLGGAGLIAWSDDGSSWTAGTTVGSMNTYDAVFDGSVWWAVGGEAFTQIITSSDNGETWTIVLASGDLDDFGGVGYSIALKP